MTWKRFSRGELVVATVVLGAAAVAGLVWLARHDGSSRSDDELAEIRQAEREVQERNRRWQQQLDVAHQTAVNGMRTAVAGIGSSAAPAPDAQPDRTQLLLACDSFRHLMNAACNVDTREDVRRAMALLEGPGGCARATEDLARARKRAGC